MSVLKKPEITAQYSQHYLGAHADFGELELDDKDPLHQTVKRHNPRKLRPVLVFLDASGKEVMRLRGRLEPDEALLVDRYVSGRHYLKTDYPGFKAAQGG